MWISLNRKGQADTGDAGIEHVLEITKTTDGHR
jgi:hypothetical protein